MEDCNSGAGILFNVHTKRELQVQKLTQVHVDVATVDLKPVPV